LAARAAQGGRSDFLPMWAGQNVSGCKEVPAAQLTEMLAADSRESQVGNRKSQGQS
jgi:nitronate monooxygenase